jgi:hypothetical protein
MEKKHKARPQAPSGHFTSKTTSLGKTYTTAVANCIVETPPTDIHHQKTTKHVPKTCTDGNMATFITTVQQIVTGLQTAGTVKDRLSPMTRAVYGLVMWK